MTHRILLLVFCFLSYVKTDAQSWKKDIETSIDALNKAIISQDKPALEKLTAEELSYGHSIGLVEDKTSFVNAIMSGATKFTQIDNADQTMSLAGDNAVVRNICSIKGTKNDGSLLDIKIGILMVWKKDGGHWKLLARQGYKLQ